METIIVAYSALGIGSRLWLLGSRYSTLGVRHPTRLFLTSLNESAKPQEAFIGVYA